MQWLPPGRGFRVTRNPQATDQHPNTGTLLSLSLTSLKWTGMVIPGHVEPWTGRHP